MNTIFADVVMRPEVDTVYKAIEQDGLRDWRKLYWEGNKPSWPRLAGSKTLSPGARSSYAARWPHIVLKARVSIHGD